MNSIDDGTDYVEYKHIHKNILGGSVPNISLVIFKSTFGSIENKYSSCRVN